MEIIETHQFHSWLVGLRDRTAKARINARLRTIATTGQLTGGIKSVGGDVLELRFHIGPGYRVYATQNGVTLLVLLVGGNKSSQRRDIIAAQNLVRKWKDEYQN